MKILLVEDDKQTADYIAKGLREHGHVVDHADNGRDGLYLATGEKYDVLIVDRMLPQMDGLSLVKAARASGMKAPVLFLTTMGGVDDRVAGLEAGGDDYLTKPFAFAEFLARVRALLRRFSSQGAGVTTRLTYEDLELDLLSREVKRGGELVQLTQKEFSLLEYLMRNAGRPVSRTSIAEHVWDIHYDSGSNVIDVCVNTLRKKVDNRSPKKLIQTVIGVGYMLKSPD